MSRHPNQYNMGHTRAHVFPTPRKIQFTEHNGRTVCANPTGVPVKWLPVYLELASRMYDNGPSFAIGKDENERGNPVTLRLKDECGSWSTISDPTDAARIIGMTTAPKPEPKPGLCYHGANHCGVLGSQVCKATPRKASNPTVVPVGVLRNGKRSAPTVIAPKADDVAIVITPAELEALAEPDIQPTDEAPNLPEWAEEWLAGLVFETKRDYARQYLEHLLCGADTPVDPATDWAHKARKRADRLAELAA